MLCISIAKQRLGKHIPVEANARNNMTSITRQRISKYAFLTTEAAFSTWSVQNNCKEDFSWEDSVVAKSWESSVEEELILVSVCQEMGRVLEMAV
jgi:hypothetical protein